MSKRSHTRLSIFQAICHMFQILQNALTNLRKVIESSSSCSCSCSCSSCGHINQNTALLSNLTMLSAYCTIEYSLARQPYPATLPGSLARQPCTAALPGNHARQPCPATMHGSLARQPCPAALPGSLAQQPCPAALHKSYKLKITARPDRKVDFYLVPS
jgi:hypothetical protein